MFGVKYFRQRGNYVFAAWVRGTLAKTMDLEQV